jgi:hypothetical protein
MLKKSISLARRNHDHHCMVFGSDYDLMQMYQFDERFSVRGFAIPETPLTSDGCIFTRNRNREKLFG